MLELEFVAHRILSASVATALFCVVLAPAARADEPWRTTVLEENDSLYFSSDRHYTQGLRLSVLSPVLQPQGWADGLYNAVGDLGIPTVFAPGGTRRTSLFVGQSIFTPENLNIKPPSPRDRPYGGWLYAGDSLLQETGNSLENLELDLGVVGPGAFGEQVQNDWHQFIGIHQAQGWSNQLQNEPGLVLSYERSWRIPLVPIGNRDGVENGIDIVPELGGTGGNVFTYADGGAQIRFGRHLEADYGQVHVRPALSGTDYFNPAALDDDLGYYLFAGVQGRAVARNIFLDGNTFRQSASVTHKIFVADLTAGVSVFWSTRIRLDLSVMRRTPEFVGQHSPDVGGSAAVAFSW
jgi:hypothetical protein